MTAIRDQGSDGTCWAHGACASLESYLMPNEDMNFSENNLVNLHGFDVAGWVSGNADMATAYFVRWDGPAAETSDPYPSPGTSSVLPPIKHVQDVLILPAKSSATDNDLIKQTLIDYGGICANYYSSTATNYYKASTHAYYYTGTGKHNHMVMIVGWDDSYSSTNFATTPPGNGAYIVKNSWGTNWGENGYFYVSYYDLTMAYYTLRVFTAESTNHYEGVYQYDPLGWIGSRGYSSTTAWGANIFTATASKRLGAVGFYAAAMNTTYLVYVYTGVTAGAPTTGTLAATKSGTCTYAGYHTIPLDQTVDLTSGQRFSIVVKFTTPNYNYPIPVEYAQSDYTSAATVSAGQSFISSSGSGWFDAYNITGSYTGANVCIKGYLADQTQPTVTVNQAAGQADPTSVATIHFTVVFSEAVTNFTAADVTISGTAAGATVSEVTGSGTTYDVAVSGMTSSGTVIAAIAAGVVTDPSGNLNTASTSSDNSVTYAMPSVVTSTSSVTVPEGSTATFQVKLSALPAASTVVTVTHTSGDSDITVSNGSSLTFTTSNWNTYQTVTLAAAQDADFVNGTATILCSASGLASASVTATESDDDSLDITSFSLGGQNGQNLNFQLNAPSGSDYFLQRSTNLITWITISNVSAKATLSLPKDTQLPTCFFRIRSTTQQDMVTIPAGTNIGTDPDDGAYALTNESAFYMDATEVTKAQWDGVYNWAVTNGYGFDNAGTGKAADHPVVKVNWYDCVKWCNARSQKEGRTPCYTVSNTIYKTGQSLADCNVAVNGYRLPTTKEWEYAARGGLTGKRFPWGDTITHSQANYYSSSSLSYDISTTRDYNPTYYSGGAPLTNPVYDFPANGYGLYGMAGNAAEWCYNGYLEGDLNRGWRGGSYAMLASNARCGADWYYGISNVDYGAGFRTIRR